jgi:predicted GTPase
MSNIFNVVVFGESGVGKSSVIHMLFNHDIAEPSDAALGFTFESKLYKGTRDGYSFNIYDTAGLNESDNGRVKPDVAIGNLMKLVGHSQEGIHLLIMCMRKGRINSAIANNYQLFYNGIFGTHVPIILVVTHCELDDPIDSWKTMNQSLLRSQFKMEFNDIICVTTLNKGKHAAKFQTEYASSREELGRSIVRNSLKKAWVIENFADFIMVMMKRIWNLIASYFNFPKVPLNNIIYSIFQKLGFGDTEATEKANKLVDELKETDMSIQVIHVDDCNN